MTANSLPKPLDRSAYAMESTKLAVSLLGKVLVGPNGSGYIVETEAYGGGKDPASHGSRGMTPRTEVMFGPPGHLYVYFTYGMHYCANVVSGKDGESSAVLLRAIQPLTGIKKIQKLRPGAKSEKDLCNGPAKLTQALGIGKKHNGTDLTRSSVLFIYEDEGFKPPKYARSSRIGISKATDLQWRFYLPDNPNVSRYRTSDG